jgi:hypothetical protein
VYSCKLKEEMVFPFLFFFFSEHMLLDKTSIYGTSSRHVEMKQIGNEIDLID